MAVCRRVTGAGANKEGDDASSMLAADWKAARRSVLRNNGITEFRMRQYLFAAQVKPTRQTTGIALRRCLMTPCCSNSLGLLPSVSCFTICNNCDRSTVKYNTDMQMGTWAENSDAASS